MAQYRKTGLGAQGFRSYAGTEAPAPPRPLASVWRFYILLARYPLKLVTTQ